MSEYRALFDARGSRYNFQTPEDSLGLAESERRWVVPWEMAFVSAVSGG